MEGKSNSTNITVDIVYVIESAAYGVLFTSCVKNSKSAAYGVLFTSCVKNSNERGTSE